MVLDNTRAVITKQIKGLFRNKPVDKGRLFQQTMGRSLESGFRRKKEHLDDLILVEPTIKECLNAFKINGSVSSGIILLISYVIGDINITSKKENDTENIKKIEDVIDRIQLEDNLPTMIFNLLITGRSFNHILKNANEELIGIDILYEYDNHNRFIEVKNWYGELLGYKAQAQIKRPKSNWKQISFEEYQNENYETVTINYEVDEILYIEMMGFNMSPVSLTLDNVYLYKVLTNNLPTLIDRNFKDIYISAGTDETPFEPYDIGMTDEQKYMAKKQMLAEIKRDYANWINNSDDHIIAHDFLFKPNFLASNGLDLTAYLDILNTLDNQIKLEILSPNGLFNSNTGTRSNLSTQVDAVVEPFVHYIRRMIIKSIRQNIISQIVPNYADYNVTFDTTQMNMEEKMASVASKLEQIFPSSNIDEVKARQELYFPRYAHMTRDIEKKQTISSFNSLNFQDEISEAQAKAQTKFQSVEENDNHKNQDDPDGNNISTSDTDSGDKGNRSNNSRNKGMM
jgi:hypothetical protein